MTNKIIFNDDTNNLILGEKISFDSLHEGMTISFYDDDEKLIFADVVELCFATDEKNKIIGCFAESNDGTSYELYEENEVLIYSTSFKNQNSDFLKQTEIEGVLIPKDEKENSLKRQIPNIFSNRLESEIDNSKFPEWDILPPNQFINPRLKP